MRKIKIPKGHRDFIWVLVAIIVVFGSLLAYIQISSIPTNKNASVDFLHIYNDLPGLQASKVPSGPAQSNLQILNNPECSDGTPMSTTECVVNLPDGLVKYTNSNYNFSLEFPDSYKLDTITVNDNGSENLDFNSTNGSRIGFGIYEKSLSSYEEQAILYRAPHGLTKKLTLGTHEVDFFDDQTDVGGPSKDYVFSYKNLTFAFYTEEEGAIAPDSRQLKIL